MFQVPMLHFPNTIAGDKSRNLEKMKSIVDYVTLMVGIGSLGDFKQGLDAKLFTEAQKIFIDQCIDRDWVIFKMILTMKLRHMFNRFQTKYTWNSQSDQNVYDGFINVLKSCFRDIMKNLRKQSKENARIAGHGISDDEENFDITCNVPLDTIPIEKWKRMCKYWNTERWKVRSKAARANRNNDLCRHTGGSMGFDEHRLHLIC